ncbi:MAG: AAA-associated domain-containing protein [Candidatus Micrarchaeia archaeon]
MGKRTAVFPQDAKFNRVMGILRILYHNKGKMSIGDLTAVSKEHVDTLLPQVNAAKMLKLVHTRDKNVMLTKLGEALHKNDADAIKTVSDELKEIEPFKTAYNLSKDMKRFTTDELNDKICNNGIKLDANPDKGRESLEEMLMQWAIYFSILDYNGVERIWLEE